MRKNKHYTRTTFIIFNFFFGSAITTFLILGFLLEDSFFFYMIIPSAFFLVFFNIALFRFSKRQRRHKRFLEVDSGSENEISLHGQSKKAVIDTKELESNSNLDAFEDWDIPIILVDIFTGAIANQKCAICKLSFDEKETVLQCKNCQSLFHKEHLKQWLATNSSCPVCDSELKIK